jgi:integrase
MAYIREVKGKGGKRYYATFPDETGKSREVALPDARTKTEARELAAALQAKARRIRSGQEAPPPPPCTFKTMAERWSKEVLPKRRGRASRESRLRVHLLPAFGPLALAEITAERIDTFLDSKEAEIGETSIEHLRRQLRAMLNWAAEKKLVRFPDGKNPAAAAQARRLVPRPTQWLESHEVPAVLAATPPRWRPFFTCAVYTGMRKGEVAGLRKSDVDLKRRVIRVARSYDQETKTDRVRHVPICDELLPVLAAQLDAKKGPLVFPRPDGRMVQRWEATAEVLKRALRRAGIVEHYDMKCRRKGCGYSDRRYELIEARCPRCSFKLWPVAVPRPLVFHDTRSTFATHLGERTQDLHLVQKLLGHSSPEITARVYQGVRDPYALAGVNLLRFSSEISPRSDGKTGQTEAKEIKASVLALPENASGCEGWRAEDSFPVPTPEPKVARSNRAPPI